MAINLRISAPGRTRTGSLLFRRWLSSDAVLECEVAGRQRPQSESYRVVGPSRFVTLSSEKALSRYRAYPAYRRCTVAAGRSQSGRRSSGRSLHAGSLRGAWRVPRRHSRLLCPLVDPSGSGVAPPQGTRARWIHRRVRAFWLAFGRRCLPGNLSRTWLPSPCPAALPTVVLCRINHDVPNPRLEITSSAAAGVLGRARRCRANQWYKSI
jgi:hypothetical protein